MSQPHCIALVPAAGIGERALTKQDDRALPKQYQQIAGVSMLRRSVLSLMADERVKQVIVVVRDDDPLAEELLNDLSPRVFVLKNGGSTRMETVNNGLQYLASVNPEWVLVHDAARPALSLSSLVMLLDECLSDEVGGLLALPVADTLKRTVSILDENGQTSFRVEKTVDRTNMWQAQTPQVFRYQLLCDAITYVEQNSLVITDEASAIEALGLQPKIVLGSLWNFKVTWPQDFMVMERVVNEE